MVLGFNVGGILCSPVPRKTFNYAKTDTDILLGDLRDADWEREGRNLTVEQYWTMLKGEITQAIDKAVPQQSIQDNRRKKWMDSGTLKSVRTKHKLFRRWLQSRSGEDYTAYVRSRNRASKACRKAKAKLEETVASNAKKNRRPSGHTSSLKHQQKQA